MTSNLEIETRPLIVFFRNNIAGHLHANHHHPMAQAMILPTSQSVVTTTAPMPPSPLSQRRIQQMQMAEMARQQRLYNDTRMRGHHEEEEEPLIPPRSSSKPQIVRSIRPQTPPSHPRVFEASNEMHHQRLHTPPRALLNMDITQRNMHELQTRSSLSPPPGPPPPAPTQEIMHPPIAALVSQRREAMVRTNPQLRHVRFELLNDLVKTRRDYTFFIIFSNLLKLITKGHNG